MKRLMKIGAAVIFMAGMSANADIGISFTSGGTYLPGGDFATGPYPEPGFLYQVLWAPVDPTGYTVSPGGVGSGEEYVLFRDNSSRSFGYVYFGDAPTIEVTSGEIGGANPNTDGFVYARLFSDAGADASASYYQTAPVPTTAMPTYVSTDPSSIYNFATDAAELGMTVVPEPSTGLLLALAGVVIGVRRRFAR